MGVLTISKHTIVGSIFKAPDFFKPPYAIVDPDRIGDKYGWRAFFSSCLPAFGDARGKHKSVGGQYASTTRTPVSEGPCTLI